MLVNHTLRIAPLAHPLLSLPATLITCLRQNPTLASLILQYITTGISWTRAVHFCSAASICKALLENIRLFHDVDSLEALCSVLNTAMISPLPSIFALYTGKRCSNAVYMLLNGNQHHSEIIVTLAVTLLAGFCSLMEDGSMLGDGDEKEEASCLDTVRGAAEQGLQQQELALLSRLQGKLEARVAKREGRTAQFEAKRANTEADSQAHFLSVMRTRQEELSGWCTRVDPPAVAKSVQPEVANLLHFLVSEERVCSRQNTRLTRPFFAQIDEYYSWQAKIDAVKALLNARVYHQAASVKDYEQLYLDLFHGAASGCAVLASTPTTLGGNESHATLWRSALCGLLPSLVVALEADRLAAKKGQDTFTTTECMASVIGMLSSDPANILTGCEVMLASPEDQKKKRKGAESEADMMLDVFIGGSEEGPTRHPVRAALLRSLEDKGLLRREDWNALEGLDTILADWQDLEVSFLGEVADGTDAGASLALLFEQKLQVDVLEDGNLLTRLVEDYASQQAFAQAVTKYICDCKESSELESVAKVCRLLMSDIVALDIILLYISPAQLLQPVAGQLEDDEMLQNDEEPAVIGTILLFAQLLVQKSLDANHTIETLLPGEQSHHLASLVRALPAVQVYSSLSSTEQSAISNWITALFGSEGIPDELIKSSSPQLMLRLSPTLFSQSVTACFQGVIDMDTLRGGLTYFLQDLLSYTLPGAISWLLCDLSRCHEEETKAGLQDVTTKAKWSRQSQVRMDVLSMLLLSESCPRIVHSLVSQKAIEVLGQYEELSSDLQRVMSELSSVLEPSRAAKTHLWIKIVEPSMPFCNVDSLLGLDASLAAIAAKRGNKAALQIVFDSLLAHAKSDKLPRAVAMSLMLAHIARRGITSNLADDIIVSFATRAVTAPYPVKSVMLTAGLVMEMLSYNAAAMGVQTFEAVQAIVALRIMRMLKVAREKDDLHRITQSYSPLFCHLDTCTLLSRSFSRAS